MDSKLRIVTQLPLRGLWQETGPLAATRVRPLSSSDIRDLLRAGAVHFVVVDVGHKPRWIDLEDCYRFWMDEVKAHLAEPGTKNENDGVYSYQATEWRSEQVKAPVIVLESRH